MLDVTDCHMVAVVTTRGLACSDFKTLVVVAGCSETHLNDVLGGRVTEIGDAMLWHRRVAGQTNQYADVGAFPVFCRGRRDANMNQVGLLGAGAVRRKVSKYNVARIVGVHSNLTAPVDLASIEAWSCYDSVEFTGISSTWEVQSD